MHRDHKKLLKNLGANLRAKRNKIRLSIQTLSNLSGVPKGSIEKIENGGNLTMVTLGRLCWSLGVHPRDVFPDLKPALAPKVKS